MTPKLEDPATRLDTSTTAQTAATAIDEVVSSNAASAPWLQGIGTGARSGDPFLGMYDHEPTPTLGRHRLTMGRARADTVWANDPNADAVSGRARADTVWANAPDVQPVRIGGHRAVVRPDQS